MNDFFQRRLLIAALAGLATGAVSAQSVDVTVRRAPYVISTVSSKSEKGWVNCKYCGSKTSYERTYKWDVYNHVWIETTKAENVPETCRKCSQKAKEQERLNREERALDAKIEYQRTRIRIRDKKRELESLRQEAR